MHNGKTLIHEFITHTTEIIDPSGKNVDPQHSYTVNNYESQTGIYCGTVELDTTWYISGGQITSWSNNIWGSVPNYQLPDYWSSDNKDVYYAGSTSQAVSWGQATLHHIEVLSGVEVGRITYHLETDINGNGGYTDSFYIASTFGWY